MNVILTQTFLKITVLSKSNFLSVHKKVAKLNNVI